MGHRDLLFRDPTYFNLSPTADPRTRGSVRRASGFVQIVTKTIGAAPLITQILKRIERIDEAYLYGSFAGNQQDAASDIDVLVIGAPREEVLAQAVRRLERQLGREISYTVLTPKEFESRRARKDAFLENVWHNKRISLIGRDGVARQRFDSRPLARVGSPGAPRSLSERRNCSRQGHSA